MQKWKISEAKAKLTDLLTSAKKDPQIICNRENPVSAVLDITLFEELMKLRKDHQKPTIAQLLLELDKIKGSEPSEIEITPRRNRPNPFEESADEMAL